MHSLSACEGFKRKSAEERFKVVKDDKLGKNCFKQDRFAFNCEASPCSAAGCGMKHNILLHLDKKSSRKPYSNYTTADSTHEVQTMVKSVAEAVSISHQADVLSTSKVSSTPTKKIALLIVSVKVRSTDGNRWLNTYALLDSGSTNSFCSKSIMQQLEVKGKDVNLQLTTLEGTKGKA